MSSSNSVNSMLISLKNNSMLLKRPPAFSKIKQHIQSNIDKKISLSHKVLDDKELREIRASIVADLREKNKKKVKFYTVGLCIVLSLCLFSVYWISRFNFIGSEPEAQLIKVDSDKVMFYINDGHKWLKQKHYKNAEFQFELAIKLDPSNSAAHLGLLEALKAGCQNDSNKCMKVALQEKRIDSLMIANP